jgi:hypothetical protein
MEAFNAFMFGFWLWVFAINVVSLFIHDFPRKRSNESIGEASGCAVVALGLLVWSSIAYWG